MTALGFVVDTDGVALLTVDVPGRSMNVLTPELTEELDRAITRIAEEAAIKGAVLVSGKSNGFIAGADLTDLVTAYGKETPAEAFQRSAALSGIYRRLETCGKPVAAAINGLALGGGLELCLACHYRVLADDPKSVVGLPEVKVGLLPGAGGTQRLPRLIGIPAALKTMLSGDPVAPAEALKLGIVQAVAPSAELVGLARVWVLAHPEARQPWDVKGFAVPGGVGCLAPHAIESFQAGTSRLSNQTQRNYPAPPAIASCVFEGTIVPIDTGLRIESKYFAKLLTDPVARNLMRTMFIVKGAADKLVRRPSGIPKSKVAKLGVIGAGMMGAGIAHVASAAGIEVVLIDATAAQAEKGKAHSAGLLQKEIDKGRLTREAADARLQRIEPTVDYVRLKGADLVIEAVFESREVKRGVLERVVAAVGGLEGTGRGVGAGGSDGPILASNTSTLPITGLASFVPDATRFIGIHFFSPVDRMALVEIIKGRETGDAALACALDFVGQLRKTPIVVHDSPGFFTSRVFGAFVDEGMAMLAEGVAPALIENAARMAGMPVGPLALTDEVTIDLQLKVHDQAVADGLAPQFQRLTAIDVVRKMMALGRVGRRGGAGFYDYPPGTKKRLWPGLAEIFPLAPDQPDAAELRTRFLYIQAVETARAKDEGVIPYPEDADLGSILGIGYPSWTGGTLSFIDTVGRANFVAECRRLAQRYGARFSPPEGLLAG